RCLPPFPTRRSSDLCTWRIERWRTSTPVDEYRMTLLQALKDIQDFRRGLSIAISRGHRPAQDIRRQLFAPYIRPVQASRSFGIRSEEHTSELQSREN